MSGYNSPVWQVKSLGLYGNEIHGRVGYPAAGGCGTLALRDCLRHDVTERLQALPHAELEAVILDDLLRRWGPLLQGEALRSALGFPTMTALRQAITRGTTPVPVFKIDGRRGRYAHTWTVARWLASQGTAGTTPPPASTPKGGSHSDAVPPLRLRQK